MLISNLKVTYLLCLSEVPVPSESVLLMEHMSFLKCSSKTLGSRLSGVYSHVLHGCILDCFSIFFPHADMSYLLQRLCVMGQLCYHHSQGRQAIFDELYDSH